MHSAAHELLFLFQAQEKVAGGRLVLPRDMELRGPTRDEAVLAPIYLPPILALAAPGTGAEHKPTVREQRTQEQAERDEAEAEDIEEELAELLNEEGVFCTGRADARGRRGSGRRRLVFVCVSVRALTRMQLPFCIYCCVPAYVNRWRSQLV